MQNTTTCFRGTALSLTVTVGRVGSVLGNIMFGGLIDTFCIVPFIVFTIALTSKYVLQEVRYLYHLVTKVNSSLIKF